MPTQKQTLLIASALGFLAVAIGAFGAHALKSVLTAHGRTDTFELAVRYHFYHSFALLSVGLLMDRFQHKGLRVSAFLFLTGTFLFSGSLYLLCLSNLPSMAMFTPFGGVFLIAGWIMLFISILRSTKN